MTIHLEPEPASFAAFDADFCIMCGQRTRTFAYVEEEGIVVPVCEACGETHTYEQLIESVDEEISQYPKFGE